MTRPPAYQCYANDDLAKFVGLSLAAIGACHKIELMMWGQSLDQSSFIDDDVLIARTLGTSIKEWKELRKEIQHPARAIFKEEGGYLVSSYLLERRKEQTAWRKKSRQGGIQSGKTRALKAQEERRVVEGCLANGSTKVQPTGTPPVEPNTNTPTPFPSPIPTPSPIPIPKYKQEGRGREAPLRDVSEKQFEVEFWTPYPERDGKKIGKQQAFEKYKLLSTKDRALIAIAVQHLAQHPPSQDGIGVKDAHRWIKNSEGDEPWREWIEETQQTQKKNGAINVRDSKDYVSGT